MIFYALNLRDTPMILDMVRPCLQIALLRTGQLGVSAPLLLKHSVLMGLLFQLKISGISVLSA